MSTTLVWSNILAYSLQVGLLVAVAAFVPALVRMRAAGARLLYWQLLLAACLLLPWVQRVKPGAKAQEGSLAASEDAKVGASRKLFS